MDISKILEGFNEHDLSKTRETVLDLIDSNKKSLVEYISSHSHDFDKFVNFSEDYSESLNTFENKKLEELEKKQIEEEISKINDSLSKHQSKIKVLQTIQELESHFQRISDFSSEHTVDDLVFFTEVGTKYFSKKNNKEEEEESFESSKVFLRYKRKYEKWKKQICGQIARRRYYFRFEETRINFPKGNMMKYMEILNTLDLFSPGFIQYFFEAYQSFIRKVIVGGQCDIVKEVPGEYCVEFRPENEEESNKDLKRVDRIIRRIYGIFKLLDILNLNLFVTKRFCTNIRKIVLSPIISNLQEEEILKIQKMSGPIPEVFRKNVLDSFHVYQFLSRSEQRIRRIRALLLDYSQIKRLKENSSEILLGAYELVDCVREWVGLMVVPNVGREDILILAMKENMILLLDLFLILTAESRDTMMISMTNRSMKYVSRKFNEILLSIAKKRKCEFRNDVYELLLNTKDNLSKKK